MDNLFLFYGDERFLIDEHVEKIKNMIVPKELETVNFTVLDGKTVPVDDIINSARTVPMLTDKRMVLIVDARFFQEKGGSSKVDAKKTAENDILIEFLQELPAYTYLLFIAQSVDKRKKLFKFIHKNGVVREFSPLSQREKTNWIQQRLSVFGKKAEVSIAAYIAQYTHGLYQTDSELKKLISYAVDKSNIEQVDIDAVFSKTLENSIFDLIDYVGMKKPSQALFILNELLVQGEKGIIILFMISKHIMNLMAIKMMEGLDFNEIRQALNIHPYVLKKALQQCKNFSIDELKKALKLCQETDLDIKKGKINDTSAVEFLLLKLAN